VAEGVVFRPIIVNWDEDDKVNGSCKENDEPGERKKPGFGSPGKRIEDEDEVHSQDRMKTRTTGEEMDYFDIIYAYNVIRGRG